MQHIPVGDDIVFAFEAKFTGLTRARFAAAGDITAIGDCRGADEPLLEIAVNDAGRLRRLGALLNRPGARLFRSDREEGDEMQQLVACPDYAVEARLVEADRLEIVALLLGRQYGGFAADLCAGSHGGSH